MPKLAIIVVLFCTFSCNLAQMAEGEPMPMHPAHMDPGDSEGEVLVRCKRPMCRMFCPYGFRTGEDGCPTCQCEDNPCERIDCPPGLTCRPKRCQGGPCPAPEAECVALALDCPLMKCVACEHGYFKDQHGCRTCDCLPEDAGLSGIAVDPPMPCPMPMCADPCPSGFKNDARGCMSCQCASPPQELAHPTCQGEQCAEGLACYMKTPGGCSEPDCHALPVCTVPSLCHSMKSHFNMQTPEVLDQFPEMASSPLCREDGTFSPTQCNEETKDCWCVDDRGQSVEGRRSGPGLETLHCQENRTSVLHVNFVLAHDLEDDELTITLQSGNLHAVIKEHFSRWVAMKTEFIVISTVIPAEGRLLIQVVLMQDGVTDLPSAANHLGNEMRRDHCRIPYHDRFMTPDPESVQVHHQYVGTPHLPPQGIHDYEEGFCMRHRTAMMVGSIGAFVFFVMMLSLGVYVCTKKRRSKAQFDHKKLFEQFEHPDMIVTEKEPKNVELLSKEAIA